MKANIIVECCQNHNADQEVLKKMIHEAAENGANFVKIQSIRSRELTFRERFEHGETDQYGNIKVIKRPYKTELERLQKLDLTIEKEQWFVDECRKAGVKSMTTTFTKDSIDEVKDLNFDAIKVASYDCSAIPLLVRLKELEKKLFISTGATYDDEISEACKALDGSDFELLHCVTIYPTPMDQLNLARIEYLQKFTPKVGYSDHSNPYENGTIPTKIALALGATCIERHYTVLKPDETRDGPVSINPGMLRDLRTFADYDNETQWGVINKEFPEWKLTLGDPERQLSHHEELNRDYYRGRFASIRDDGYDYNWE